MNYIILDIEANCWKERNVRKQNEIIEIGAVKINRKGLIIDEFNEFIKPKINPKISPFCKELTTITQKEISSADYFPAVIKRFNNWINLNKPFYLCSWGFFDKNQFEKDCKLHQINTNWLKNHISLKHQYTEIKKLKKHIGMSKALKIEKILLKGTHHRGIDDAKNIAQIFIANFNKWTF